jgi:hypothetical protein
MRKAGILVMFLASVLASPALEASTLFIGHDTAQPMKEYTTAGAYIQDWGTSSSTTGPAIDEFGNVYICTPAFGANSIEKVNSSNVFQYSVTATVDGQWIEDMGYYGGGTLLAGTFEGNVFKVDGTTGAHTFLFGTGGSFTGVTYDGTDIWTTDGFFGTNVTQRTTTGTPLFSFAFDLTNGGPGGIGYDPADGTLYIGTLGGWVYHYDTAGTQLGLWNTGYGNAVDGLEVKIPEPTTLGLLLVGSLSLLRRRG